MNPGNVGQAPPPDAPALPDPSPTAEGGCPTATAEGGCPAVSARRPRRRRLPGLVCAALCLATAVAFQMGADRARSADTGASVSLSFVDALSKLPVPEAAALPR